MKKKLFIVLGILIPIFTLKAKPSENQEQLVVEVYYISMSVIRMSAFSENDVRNEWMYQLNIRQALGEHYASVISESRTRWEKDTYNNSPGFRWRVLVKRKGIVCYDLYIDLVNKVLSNEGVWYVLPGEIENVLNECKRTFDILDTQNASIQREYIRARSQSN